jgi:hypothetical protein
MRIADISERVYVFGEPDWKPPRHPNLRVIKLQQGIKLAREWFVIADSPSLSVAFVAVDEGDFSMPVLEERYFRALKTHDPALVQQLAAAAERIIDDALKS